MSVGLLLKPYWATLMVSEQPLPQILDTLAKHYRHNQGPELMGKGIALFATGAESRVPFLHLPDLT